VNQDDHLFVAEPCKKEELAFGIIYTVQYTVCKPPFNDFLENGT
jgi:hypothetical protein